MAAQLDIGRLTALAGRVRPGMRLAASAVGRALRSLVAYLGEFFLLGHAIVMHVLRGEVTRRELFEQMWRCGVAGLPLVAVTVGFSGLVFGVYTVAQFKQFGATEFIGGVVGISMAREVAPVLTATVMAARTGSSIAAEVSTMKITEQIDALRALATDPIEYLAVPRYVALVLTLPLLALVGMATGTLGAASLATLQGVPLRQFFDSLQQMLPMDYVVTGCTKAMVFGALMAIASLRQGLRCGHGSAAVGQATTQAVVLCVLWIHLANLLLAIAAS